MSVATTASQVLHVLVGAIWVGAIVFVVTSVLPTARDGDLNPQQLAGLTSQLRRTSRIAAVLILATGGHLAGTRYTADSLTGTGDGHLVLTMAVLWLVVTGLVEAGTGRVLAGTDEEKVREPARHATRLLQVAALGGAGILVVAALIGT